MGVLLLDKVPFILYNEMRLSSQRKIYKMEKKEAQKIFKDYMKSQGFKIKGSCAYKYIDDDYLVCAALDHRPFGNEYGIDYGAIYNPTETDWPFYNHLDWRFFFQFTTQPGDDLNKYSIDELDKPQDLQICSWFDYDTRTKEEFENSISINVVRMLSKLYDKEYVLNRYRKNWILFRQISYKTVRKICALAGIDAEEAIRVRDSNLRKWPIDE